MKSARKVGARGTVDSPLVIILEAPGAEELKYGAPVCGPSGDLLDKCVPPDFDFDTAYVINAMQCRPPKTRDQKADKEYKSKACAACRQRVLSQVYSHPRKAVLAMGAWSNTALTGNYNFKITQQRGNVYHIVNPGTGEKVAVVPTVHPAYLLRGAGNYNVFKDDIAVAYNLAFAGIRPTAQRSFDWKNPANQVLESLYDFVEYVRHLDKVRQLRQLESLPLAADIETTGFNPWVDIIRSIGFYLREDSDTAAIVPKSALLDKAYCRYLRLFLQDKRFRFIWQNGKFDELFLIQEELVDVHHTVQHEDTLLLSYALSEATKDHDLDEQAKNVLGAPNHKKEAIAAWGKKADDFYRNAPDPIIFDYQARDLKKTYMLWEYNRPQVAKDEHLEKLYTRTLIPAAHMLTRIENHGMFTDADFARINRFGATQEDLERGLVRHQVKKEWKIATSLVNDKGQLYEPGLENEQAMILNELEKLAGWRCNPNSPPEVAQLLYDQLCLTINSKRPQDTRKETLDKLPMHPAVKLIRRFRSAVKMLSTYVGAVETLAINGVIHTTYKLHVTPTGRLSSSNPNIQNIPRDARFRRMYRARPGYVLLESDYNSAELRMLACLSLDEFLTSVFLDDKRNLHDEVSVAMYGADFTEDDRIRAKAINFGIPYGRDAFSVALEFDMQPDEAQRLINAWFARAPGAKKFLDAVASVARNGGSLITVFGRKRRSGVVSPERLDGLQNEFKNFHFQSHINDFTLHSAIEAQDEIERYDAHFVNLIHDSTLTEVPDDLDAIIPVAKLMKQTMEDVPKKWIETPILFKADQKIGTNWGMGQSFEKWLAVRMEERPTLVSVPSTYQVALLTQA